MRAITFVQPIINVRERRRLPFTHKTYKLQREQWPTWDRWPEICQRLAKTCTLQCPSGLGAPPHAFVAHTGRQQKSPARQKVRPKCVTSRTNLNYRIINFCSYRIPRNATVLGSGGNRVAVSEKSIAALEITHLFWSRVSRNDIRQMFILSWFNLPALF